jgi:hypothetical protein
VAHCGRRNVNRPRPLALLVERWDALPEALRAGIVAMAKARGSDTILRALCLRHCAIWRRGLAQRKSLSRQTYAALAPRVRLPPAMGAVERR